MLAFSFGQQTKKLSPLPKQLQGDIIPSFFALALDNETELGRSELKEAALKKGVKRIAISFFATWCVNCREEFKILKSNAAILEKNGVLVYLVDVGESIHDKGKDVEKFAMQYAGDSFPFWFDPNANMLKKFGLIESSQTTFELPITIVLNTDLKILGVLKEIGKDYPQILWSEL
jgi:peroxiredoxin